MYYNITKLKEKDWNIDKYLKEIAIRNYGLCIMLRDESKDFSEEELRKYFKERDSIVEKEKKEIPPKPTEEELEIEYNKYLERTAQAIKDETELLKNLKQVKFRLSKAITKLQEVPESETKDMVKNELDKLYSNVFAEINASTGFLESLIKDCNKNYDEYKKYTLTTYERKVENILKENEKEVEPSNLLAVYEEYVDLVNSLEI